MRLPALLGVTWHPWQVCVQCPASAIDQAFIVFPKALHTSFFISPEWRQSWRLCFHSAAHWFALPSSVACVQIDWDGCWTQQRGRVRSQGWLFSYSSLSAHGWSIHSYLSAIPKAVCSYNTSDSATFSQHPDRWICMNPPRVSWLCGCAGDWGNDGTAEWLLTDLSSTV